MNCQKIVQRYFDCWLKQDITPLSEIFAQDALYSECYGPEYHGITQIQRWFEDWNRVGKVHCWNIKRMIQQDDCLIAEWFFRYTYQGNFGEFDGVSIIHFNTAHRIVELREYKSESSHYFPYE